MSDLRDIAVKYAHQLSVQDYSKLLNLSDEIERLKAVVDAADAYFWASNLSQYDADSIDIQVNFEKALLALDTVDHDEQEDDDE